MWNVDNMYFYTHKFGVKTDYKIRFYISRDLMVVYVNLT